MNDKPILPDATVAEAPETGPVAKPAPAPAPDACDHCGDHGDHAGKHDHGDHMSMSMPMPMPMSMPSPGPDDGDGGDDMDMTNWETGADIAEEPEQHAFIIVGDAQLFLVHMTMFMMEAHACQCVLRVSLPPAIAPLLAAERAANPGTTFFLGNCADDLMTMAQIGAGERRSFRADIFRDLPWAPSYAFWPWTNVRPVLRKVPVVIEHVVHYRKFDLNLTPPDHPSYLMFGAGEEAHLHNLQIRPTTYDHVVSLARRPAWIDATRLACGVPVAFPDITVAKNGEGLAVCADPLPRGFYRVQYRGTSTLRDIEVAKTWWFSTKVVNPMDPCMATDMKSSIEAVR